MTDKEIEQKEFNVNTWLHNTYGLTDDIFLIPADVEALCEMLTRDVQSHMKGRVVQLAMEKTDELYTQHVKFSQDGENVLADIYLNKYAGASLITQTLSALNNL